MTRLVLLEEPRGYGDSPGFDYCIRWVPTVEDEDKHKTGQPRASSPSGPNRYLPVSALAVMARIWGYNFVVIKKGLAYSEPFMFAALRSFFGAVCLFLPMMVLRKSPRPRVFGPTLILGLLQTAGFVGLLMWALDHGSPGRTSVLVYSMPFWLMLMAWPVLGERLRGLQWVALGIALAGLILIMAPWNLQNSVSSLLATAAGFCWAASAIWAKLLRRHHRVDLVSLRARQMLLGSIPVLIIGFATRPGGPTWTGPFIWALAYNAILVDAVAWALGLYVLHRLSASLAGVGSLAVPVVGVLSAWMQFGERPTGSEAIGMAAVVIALLLLTMHAFVSVPAPTRIEIDEEFIGS